MPYQHPLTMFPDTNMPSTRTVLSTVASLAASAMLIRSIAHDFLPHEVQDYFYSGIRNLLGLFSSQMTMVVEEFDGLANNQIFEAAQIYLRTKISPSTQRLKVSKPEKEKNITVTMERNEEIVDVFDGVQFKWIFVCRQIESKYFNNPGDLNSTLRSEIRYFELTFHKKHKEKAVSSYLPYILKESKSMKEENKMVKLFTVSFDRMYGNMGETWSSINLDHPATFDTLAMDSELKKTILQDLERFVKRKEFYRRVGKAWKRGYLLYGPPGTGKSSLIAAMANYLNFDIYDLELADLRCNSDLRRMLVATANRSILVVEDIDCTIELQDRLAEARAVQPNRFRQDSQVTLSGLLNFIDGLWSSCGDERIIVFTTNHKERLDPALLRPGRMDVHIHMSYCTPCGFKLLASNYLMISDHSLFGEIEELIWTTEVTPAEVAEQLMKNDEHEIVLRGLIEFLQEKKKENEEAKARKEEGAEGQEGEKEQEVESGKQKDEGEHDEIVMMGQESIGCIQVGPARRLHSIKQTAVFSAYTTLAAMSMLLRTMTNELRTIASQFIPQQLQDKIFSSLVSLFSNRSSTLTLLIDQYNGLSINEIYEASEIYLSTKITLSVERL
ncbi:hypothetical protein HHK36_010169 [Tetracentron sinense]|uniref:AAA+ ATPase domain-containing protein n=1 Tax=Tetracentron sinense TaxID=13715 RepID=A0A835DIW7_TETSI|nr:hypothetical protein HHK36_010169 [Tetracentron sinense]